MYAAVQQQQIDIPENSWVGHTTMAGFGVMLLLASVLCIKGNKKGSPMLLWGPMVGALGNRYITDPSKRFAQKWGGGDEGFDWRSFMTFLIGMLGVTSILSAAGGNLVDVALWLQELLTNAFHLPFLNDFGAPGLCVVLSLFAMRNKGDDYADLTYGGLCALVFPLGGGSWAEVTLWIGNWIPHLMHLN